LSNDNYVVRSRLWNSSRGAATWGNGATGVRGIVSQANSLVGATPNDTVGSDVTALSNGNYVVQSFGWNDDRGPATWGNGNTGISGVVSEANSLVGTNPGDGVGHTGITALSNGNYVVGSSPWNAYRGAATWGNGNTGISGTVSEGNSLVGSNPEDLV